MSYPGMSEKEVFNGAVDVVDEYVAKGEIPVIMAWSIIRQAALRNHVELVATDSQQLKAKIRLALERIKSAALNNDISTMFHVINETYAELSAL